MRHWALASAAGAAIVLAACMGTAGLGAGASPVAPAAARYTAKGELLFPADYRDWKFLTSGHGMSYDPDDAAAEDAPFDNIFVDQRAHAAFLKSGHWPEGAVLLLERREGRTRGSINLHGAFQAGGELIVEAHVHESKRFKGGWGFFAFKPKQTAATLIDYKAECYSCHQQHAAVDTTFVQFYPTLLPVAEAKQSFSAAYLLEEKARR